MSGTTSLVIAAAAMDSKNPIQYALELSPAGFSDDGPTPSTAGPTVRSTTALVENGVNRSPARRNANPALKESWVAISSDDVDKGRACAPSE